MQTENSGVPDVPGGPLIGVTRACVCACSAYSDEHGTSGTAGTPADARSATLHDGILALDLGTTAGWALRPTEGLTTSGAVCFPPKRFDGGGMRYLRFTNWLTEPDRLGGPIGAIYFEEIRSHVGTNAAHIFGGLMATLTAWGELRGAPYQGVPVGTTKRYWAGQGNAPKQAMIAAARARGFAHAEDNAADALAIHWALETRGGVR